MERKQKEEKSRDFYVPEKNLFEYKSEEK